MSKEVNLMFKSGRFEKDYEIDCEFVVGVAMSEIMEGFEVQNFVCGRCSKPMVVSVIISLRELCNYLKKEHCIPEEILSTAERISINSKVNKFNSLESLAKELSLTSEPPNTEH